MVWPFFTRKRNLPIESSAADWKIIRVAAKDTAQRKREGGSFGSPQIKTACDSLDVKEQGAVGTITRAGIFGGLFRHTTTIVDFNHYRSGGHKGRFTAGTKDRAISIATTAAYAKLEASFVGTKARIVYGDLGENILLQEGQHTPSLYVGANIAIGQTVVLQITEANNPCYRFNAQPWADTAKKLWGDSAPNGEANQWFKSPHCPLNHIKFPGIRGWLARVVKEGRVKPGDVVRILDGGKATSETTQNSTQDDAGLPPAKRRKTSELSIP